MYAFAQSGFASLPDLSFIALRVGEDVRAAALKPAWGFHPQTPSSLRGYSTLLLLNQVSLRSLIFPLLRFALRYVRAAALKPAWGFHPQTPSSLRGGFNREGFINRRLVLLRTSH